jgi:hypothetical protein
MKTVQTDTLMACFCMQLDIIIYLYDKTLGAAVAQLVEALRYKPKGRWFDSRW